VAVRARARGAGLVREVEVEEDRVFGKGTVAEDLTESHHLFTPASCACDEGVDFRVGGSHESLL
jgi:hypothetical protein